MSQSQPEPQKTLLEDLSTLTGKAFKELDATRCELQEKERRLTNIANESMEKIKELSTINHDLQDKVGFLLDISASLNKKNDELIRSNLELEKQKFHYDQMTRDLKSKLDTVLSKEKELSMQRDFLAKQVDEKTQDLINAEKFTVIGELAARLAHDLRNPLSVVKNTMDIMRAKPNMRIEEKLPHFGRFDRAIQRMTHQIDDVLNFVKRSELLLQQTSLLSMVDSAISNTLLPPEVLILKPHTDIAINCDSRKLEAVFSNLISNAVQAMDDKGEIKIRVMDLGYNIQIEFEDTGPGIPLEIQSKIFDPLFTTKQTGTGLGLSICKNIVEQHGGTLTVKSPPTVFTVRLPKNIAPKYNLDGNYTL
ncbi:sensor histidine kinase [Candidatus Nitrosotalea okcheonensis]|uniref:Putative Histidine kinase n=1 Tax=Candidatus Nitrosotalea okcheonensis TaxID=1903276 RepID=A0A2H1FDI5_9ARCH|nr:HAMP domain-containing sensor histidine kinase [Candidatus Nitrosotalea okcheonensis]SMH70828.1 putative Histidine kinase [Candidatus Nitrosotalea okcheonensis]